MYVKKAKQNFSQGRIRKSKIVNEMGPDISFENNDKSNI